MHHALYQLATFFGAIHYRTDYRHINQLGFEKFRTLSRNMQNSMGELTSTAEQMLKGHKVVLSFGGQLIEEERFNHVSNDMRRKGMKMTAADAIADPVVQIIASFALAAVLYLATFPSIMNQNLSAGTFTVVFSSMLALMRPLKSLTNVNSQFQRGMAACQRCSAFWIWKRKKTPVL